MTISTHPLFTRPVSRFALTDGTTVGLQPLSDFEWEESQRLSRNDETGQLSSAKLMAHTVFYALVDPKPETVDAVLAMDRVRLREIEAEVAYLSHLAERPEPDADEPADGEGKEAAPDPLVEEFPAHGVDSGAAVDGAADGVPGVRVPSEPAVEGDAGNGVDHDRGREGTPGASAPGDS